MSNPLSQRVETLIENYQTGSIKQEEFCLEVAVLMQEITEDTMKETELLREINNKNRRIIALQDRVAELEFLEIDHEMMNKFINSRKLNSYFLEFAQRELSEPERPNLTRIK